MVKKDNREFIMLSRLSYRLLNGTFDRQFNRANKQGVRDERGHSLGFSCVLFEGHAVNTRGSERKKRVNDEVLLKLKEHRCQSKMIVCN